MAELRGGVKTLTAEMLLGRAFFKLTHNVDLQSLRFKKDKWSKKKKKKVLS